MSFTLSSSLVDELELFAFTFAGFAIHSKGNGFLCFFRFMILAMFVVIGSEGSNSSAIDSLELPFLITISSAFCSGKSILLVSSPLEDELLDDFRLLSTFFQSFSSSLEDLLLGVSRPCSSLTASLTALPEEQWGVSIY